MSKTNYDNTPSFYNSQEVFEKYLGRTSYYSVLQKNVIKLCKLANAKKVLELGSATGSTSFAISKELPKANVVGVDMRNDIIKIANELKEKEKIVNVQFVCNNFCDLDNYCDFDFIVMLYSFHHIEDPQEKKIEFLKNVYDAVKESTYLCIAETFLPVSYNSEVDSIKALWKERVIEGEASTFWESLNGLNIDNISFASEVGAFCGEYEGIAGDEVVERKTEFLVTDEFLCREAKNIGWNILINKACNSIGERIVLLKK